MASFRYITANAAFAANITELVYDARMFWSYMEQAQAYDKTYAEKFSNEYPGHYDDLGYVAMSDDEYDREKAGECERSHERYCSLLQQQTAIFNFGEDYDALCTGLKMLPNLRRIWILDLFQDSLDFMPFIENHSLRYHTWSQACFGFIATPTLWSEAHEIEGGLNSHPWDFRGVEHLLKAASSSAPKLEELLLGCQFSNLSTEFYSRLDLFQAMTKLAPQLTILKSDCRAPTGSSYSMWFPLITTILHEARHLEELYLTMSQNMGKWNQMFQTEEWPNLRVFDFGDAEVDLESLKAISRAQASTLRELRLRNIHLSDTKTWEEAAEELGRILKLDFIALASMSAEVSVAAGNDAYLGDEEAQVAACHFLSWIPRHSLHINVYRGAVMAWHKDNHMYDSRVDIIDAWRDDSDEECNNSDSGGP